MNQTQIMPVCPLPSAPVCRTVPLQHLPGVDRREMAICKVPLQDSLETLTQAFRSAPQFSQIPLETVLARRGQGSFRLVLLGT